MFKRAVLDNFKSFDHVELDLAGAHGKPHDHIAVFGENGSGKTNLIEAFQFLLDSTRTLSYANGPADRSVGTVYLDDRIENDSAFRKENLEKAVRLVMELSRRETATLGVTGLVRGSRTIGTEGRMRMEFTFVVNGADATYVMEFGSFDRIVSESLACRITGRTSNLFAVDRKPEGGASVRFHRSFFADDGSASRVREHLLGEWGIHTALSIFRSEVGGGGLCEEVSDVLECLDDTRVCLGGRLGPYPDLESGTAPSSRRAVLEGYQAAISKFFDRMYPEIAGARYAMDEDGNSLRYSLLFERRMGGVVREVPASMESQGIRNLLRLLPYLMDLARGRTVLIDELDAGIHMVVVEDLLKEMFELERGQLILTAHNTAILQDLEPRKAYVIRYVQDGRKEIVPFTSLARTQKNNNNEARYRQGVFDGVTFIAYVNMDGIVETFDEIAGTS